MKQKQERLWEATLAKERQIGETKMVMMKMMTTMMMIVLSLTLAKWRV